MLINEPQKSLDQSIKDVEDGMEAFEAKTTKRLADNVYQYHGIAMRKYHYGRVGKPILTIKEGTTFYDKN
jgi:hypothetical protein